MVEKLEQKSDEVTEIVSHESDAEVVRKLDGEEHLRESNVKPEIEPDSGIDFRIEPKCEESVDPPKSVEKIEPKPLLDDLLSEIEQESTDIPIVESEEVSIKKGERERTQEDKPEKEPEITSSVSLQEVSPEPVASIELTPNDEPEIKTKEPISQEETEPKSAIEPETEPKDEKIESESEEPSPDSSFDESILLSEKYAGDSADLTAEFRKSSISKTETSSIEVIRGMEIDIGEKILSDDSKVETGDEKDINIEEAEQSIAVKNEIPEEVREISDDKDQFMDTQGNTDGSPEKSDERHKFDVPENFKEIPYEPLNFDAQQKTVILTNQENFEEKKVVFEREIASPTFAEEGKSLPDTEVCSETEIQEITKTDETLVVKENREIEVTSGSEIKSVEQQEQSTETEIRSELELEHGKTRDDNPEIIEEDLETEIKPELEDKIEIASDSKPQLEESTTSDSKPEVESEIESEAKNDTDLKPEEDSEIKSDSIPDVAGTRDSDLKSEVQKEIEVDSNVDVEENKKLKPEVESEIELDSKLEVSNLEESASKPEVDNINDTESKPDVETASEAEKTEEEPFEVVTPTEIETATNDALSSELQSIPDEVKREESIGSAVEIVSSSWNGL